MNMLKREIHHALDMDELERECAEELAGPNESRLYDWDDLTDAARNEALRKHFVGNDMQESRRYIQVAVKDAGKRWCENYLRELRDDA